MSKIRFFSFYLLLATCMCLSVTAEPSRVRYEDIRNNFKQQLYARQEGLMSQQKYNIFIEPFVQEAEKTLEIAKYCKSHPEAYVCSTYFDCLLDYNVACFHHYVKPNSDTKDTLDRCGKRLLVVIQEIKAMADLTDLNVQQEFDKTVQLFTKANKRYYKKLGFRYKLLMKIL